MLPACLSAYHPPGPGPIIQALQENDQIRPEDTDTRPGKFNPPATLITSIPRFKIRSVRLQADLASPAKAGHYLADLTQSDRE